ncbi:hypothetical protein Tco_1404061 [Tanacetum coccineum]
MRSNEENADNEKDAENNEEDDENKEDVDNNKEDDYNEEDVENEDDADNNKEDDDNKEDADNEDQADNEENVDQVFRNIKMLPFLNAAKRSKKKEDGKCTILAIAYVVSDTTEADFMFRMNFITLFGSTMGTLDNGGRVSTKLLKRITEDVDISSIRLVRGTYLTACTSKKNGKGKDVKTRKKFY